ncbi:hypothetical protein ACFQMA_16635 [Halosimplex aquaticum]|uniref:Uncharacterized protein n=1 Tax=Halosimplex aquaticum TaxID=3026162 RepID=A0ABD5Y7G8_9EURY|nr:hypothetical protein [Halosimplex aquaticum]
MTDAEPVVKRADCPYEGCSADGRVVVPGGVVVVTTATTSGGTAEPYDGIVYGHCPDHEFYAYYRAPGDGDGDGDGDAAEASSDRGPTDEGPGDDGSVATE